MQRSACVLLRHSRMTVHTLVLLISFQTLITLVFFDKSALKQPPTPVCQQLWQLQSHDHTAAPRCIPSGGIQELHDATHPRSKLGLGLLLLES